jgi:hypothetical protein
MKEEDVDNDHVKDPFDALLIVDDKVKSGIQHKGLASNHSIPADGDESDRYVVVFPDLKELHKEC